MRRCHDIVVLPGDGIGPEVVQAALRVLDAAGAAHGFEIRLQEQDIGWAAVQRDGVPLPRQTLDACFAADAILLGAVGHPDAAGVPVEKRPEAGLLALRAELGCYINLRPLRIPDSIAHVSPLQAHKTRGVDMVIVRELAGGLYYGKPRRLEHLNGERVAVNTLRYTAAEIQRVAEAAFQLAAGRRRRLVSVDKANVLETSRLWRQVVDEVAPRYPEVDCRHMYVDRAAMELVLRPADLDVMLMENLFGDILSDEAAGVAGSLGLVPSASLGGQTPLFEPVHGSAPDLEGSGAANPTGSILSVAMLLEHGLGEVEAARSVERAVEDAFEFGLRTADIARLGEPVLETAEFGQAVAERLLKRKAGRVMPAGAGVI